MLRERAHLPAVVGHNYHDGVATADAVFADLVTSVTSVTNPSLTTLSHSAVKKSSRTFSPCSQRRPRRRGRLRRRPAGRVVPAPECRVARSSAASTAPPQPPARQPYRPPLSQNGARSAAGHSVAAASWRLRCGKSAPASCRGAQLQLHGTALYVTAAGAAACGGRLQVLERVLHRHG
jgi:hypothetical protein